MASNLEWRPDSALAPTLTPPRLDPGNTERTAGELSRRTFLRYSAATALALGTAAVHSGRRVTAAETIGLPAATSSHPIRVIDCHAHLNHRSRSTWEADDRKLIDAADRLRIEQLCCSILTPRRPATVEGFRECNQWVSDGIRRFPGRVRGYCYVNPGHSQEALDEIRRCVEQRGFIGIKLYNEHTCTEPIVFPIVELAIQLNVPILQHAGHAHYPLEGQPHISDGSHLAELSRRYPEAKLICAHICGGGDWEWTIKALRRAPGVFLDTSGSVTDAGVLEFAAQVLGVHRLLFGCDNSMTAGMGRIRGANLSAADKAKILGGNMARLLPSLAALPS
ncbi:MAG: amidohydrolase [Verrucomicrobia bacterium]|nr:amidohydrolase [Verrucomicrobiota bacterium]